MAKSARNWRVWSYGNIKFSVVNKAGPINFTLSNASKPVLLKCLADSGHKNQSLKRYSRFSTKFLIFRRFRTRFSWISPHGQKSRKSDLLQNLIIYRYGAACKFLGKSYGKFLKFRIFGGYFVYVFSGAAPGPSPSLKVDLLREKANAHQEWRRGIKVRASLSTKGGRPRPPTVRWAWSNWYCGPFDLALAPLRCAPLRLSAMTHGGPLVCRLYL